MNGEKKLSSLALLRVIKKRNFNNSITRYRYFFNIVDIAIVEIFYKKFFFEKSRSTYKYYLCYKLYLCTKQVQIYAESMWGDHSYKNYPVYTDKDYKYICIYYYIRPIPISRAIRGINLNSLYILYQDIYIKTLCITRVLFSIYQLYLIFAYRSPIITMKLLLKLYLIVSWMMHLFIACRYLSI